MKTDHRQRALDKIAELSAGQLDVVTLWRESAAVIATAVPYYEVPCWYTLDPGIAADHQPLQRRYAGLPT